MKISALLFLFSVFSSSITAFPHFFPNISSIPPSFLPNNIAGAWDSFYRLAGCHAGQQVPGISKLKSYFHSFGYIGNISKNFTDDFDDALEAAVKKYQLNFNLSATGELDKSTLKQILKPRCGVADFVNGSSTKYSGKAVSMTGHTVGPYFSYPETPPSRLPRINLTYAFDPRNQLTDDVKRVFANAFDRWSEWTPVIFTESSDYFTADLKVGFYGGNHGDGENFDGVLGTLAHAFAPPRGLLHLDSDETWIIDDVFASGSPWAMDLESVAVHEIGHLLGLGHSSVEDAIMFPTISSGVRKVELALDDEEAIHVLYGSIPDDNETTGLTLEMSGAHVGSSLVVNLIFLAVGLSTFVGLSY